MPRSGKRGTREKLDEPTVRACLEAFAAISSADLIDVEATIKLHYGHRHIVITRPGDTLYYTLLPEVSNTPVETTVDGILDFILGHEVAPPPAAKTVEPVQEITTASRSRFKLPLGAQIALLFITASIAVALFLHVTRPAAPTGYAFLTDGARIKALTTQYDGDYAGSTPDALSFRVHGQHLEIYFVPEAGAPRQLAQEFSFRYALRDGQVALVGPHDNILEFNSNGSLQFGDQNYPRVKQK